MDFASASTFSSGVGNEVAVAEKKTNWIYL